MAHGVGEVKGKELCERERERYKERKTFADILAFKAAAAVSGLSFSDEQSEQERVGTLTEY